LYGKEGLNADGRPQAADLGRQVSPVIALWHPERSGCFASRSSRAVEGPLWAVRQPLSPRAVTDGAGENSHPDETTCAC